MRPGRRPYDRNRDLAHLSPAEQLVEEAATENLAGDEFEEEVKDEFIERPWEPKGLKQAEAQTTVEGVNLRGSPKPPVTAGGSIPSSRTPLQRFGRDTS